MKHFFVFNLAGGEAALMPSPTRTITPQESPMQQSKRKLESTVSTENATGGAKKKEKPINEFKDDPSKLSIPEVMEIDKETSSSSVKEEVKENEIEEKSENVQDVQESLKKIEELCDELMEKTDKKKADEKPRKKIDLTHSTTASVAATPSPTAIASTKKSTTEATLASTKTGEEVKKDAIKKISSPVKRDMVKHKTLDLSSALSAISKDSEKLPSPQQIKLPLQVTSSFTTADRKNSLPEDNSSASIVVAAKPGTEKRRSRILETAEKFQNMNNQNNEKYKKFSIPGVSVGSFKKEFERKSSLTDTKKSNEKRGSNDKNNDAKKASPELTNNNSNSSNFSSSSTINDKIKENDNKVIKSNSNERPNSNASSTSRMDDDINQSDSKSSVHSFTLEEARRSMESSIALLQRAKNESQSKDVDNLCAKTESFTIRPSPSDTEREKKLQAAREIIGNAIPPSRLIGIRKPPIYGLNGRSISGGVIQTPSTPFKSNASLGRFSSIDSNSKVVPESVKGKLLFAFVVYFYSVAKKFKTKNCSFCSLSAFKISRKIAFLTHISAYS